jgi:NAD+ kinase
MRNIAIYGKSISDFNLKFLNNLIKSLIIELNANIYIYHKLKNHKSILDHFDIKFFNSHDVISGKIDLLISFGGDGTLLDTVTMIKNSNIPVLGINAGRLGFLANINQDDILLAVKALKNRDYNLDERSLLHVENQIILSKNNSNFALNEITVHKKDSSSMLKIEAFLDDEFLNTYWADGLVIATPTGSTAYSLSCGGPIIIPGSNNFVITPISPHNLNLRPMVVGDNVSIKLKAASRESFFLVSMDSRSVTLENNEEILIKKADFKLQLIELPDHNFLKTVRNKLFWGKDSRN